MNNNYESSFRLRTENEKIMKKNNRPITKLRIQPFIAVRNTVHS